MLRLLPEIKPFHELMMGVEVIKSWVALPVIGFLFWVFPALRVNSKLKKIKRGVEGLRT